MKSKNKKIFLSLGISTILIISIILIIILIPRPQNPPSVDTSNLWIWVSGNYSQNNNGTYGTKGVASEANIPGARYGSAAWIDDTGNFWLFGGSGYDNVSGANGRLNDLWKFDGASWTWVLGNYSRNNNGTYGTKGVASEANIPGARYGSATWIDDTGNFWLFGGSGYDNVSGANGRLNDLWKFDGASWTWMLGNYSRNNNGTYGTKGVANEANIPGARYGSATWIDDTGNFWLFGGSGYDNVSGSIGDLNDLWKFDGANWTWVSGNYSRNNNGTYGTKGMANEANVPGARSRSAAWIDDTGNFWLFGGSGYDNVSGANGRLNDLWKFDGANWTWVSGNYSIDNYGTYGTKGVASEANIPGARLASCSWIDDTSNFWLFGGYGYDNSSGAVGFLNDLWKFDGVNWTWVSGNYSCNNNGMYGTKGIANETNVPGSRYGSSFWTDNTGNFWLFGGYGNGNGSSSKTFGYLNDLWKFDGANWTWVSGNYSQNNNGTYGTKGVADEMNILGARAYSCPLTDTTGNFWLFGGYGYGNVSQTKDYLNDLWKYSP